MRNKTLSAGRDPVTGQFRWDIATNITAGRLFPDDNYISAKMPMKLIRPVPDSVVGSTISYDHRGYVGIEQVIKITVQGGAFPFFLEDVSLPAGATVGQTIFDNDYMVIRFTPATTGNFTIAFTVVGQDSKKIRHSHTVAVGVDWVRFLSPTGNDATGDGSYANPWATLTKAHATVTGGRAVCLKAGSYSLSSARNNLISGGVNILFSEIGRAATIDATAIPSPTNDGNPYPCWYVNSKHCFIGGIRFVNPPSAVPSPRWFSSDSESSYLHMDNCVFDVSGKSGTNNGDNVSCLFLGDSGATPSRTNVSQTRCDFLGFVGVGNGWSAIDCYGTENLVIEKNTFHNQLSSTTTAGVIWIKGLRNKNISIRQNETTDTWSGNVVDIYLGNTGGIDSVTGNIEICYNKFRGSDNHDDAVLQIARASQSGIRLPVWSYRNTIVGRYFINQRDYSVTFSSENDVVIHNHTNSDPHKIYVFSENDAWNTYRSLSYMSTLTASVTGYEVHKLPSDNSVDANLNLQGTYRTNYLGSHGAEVSMS
jgi:hypothetical protein